MTVIAANAGRFEPDRFNLFWTYYQTVLKREQAKSSGYSRLLRERAPQILDLHERVGFLLQQRSENAGGATAALIAAELRNVAWQVLADAGFSPGNTDADLCVATLPVDPVTS